MDLNDTMETYQGHQNVTEVRQNSSIDGDRSIRTVNVITYSAVISIGFVLNAVVMATYCRKLQKSTYIFVFCLAVCDEMNIFNVLLEVLLHNGVFPGTSTRALCIVQSLVADTGSLMSASLVTCVAFNRYLLLKHKSVTLPRRLCFYLVGGIVVCSVIVTLPFLVATSSKMVHDSSEYREHSCGRHYYTHSSDDVKIGLNKTSYFMLTFNAVIIALLFTAFMINIILYIKMSHRLNRMSSVRRSHILMSSGCTKRSDVYNEMANYNGNYSAESSKFGSGLNNISDCGRVIYDRNGNIESKQITRAINDLKMRKSSVLTLGQQSVAQSKKYIILVISAVILFTFYFSHFILHIIHIYHTDIDKLYPGSSDLLRIIINCLGHSYILCFIFNPVIYCFFNRRFFKNFKHILCCVSKNSKNDSRMSYEPKRLSQDSAFSICIV